MIDIQGNHRVQNTDGLQMDYCIFRETQQFYGGQLIDSEITYVLEFAQGHIAED
jgi:hypothetical protein